MPTRNVEYPIPAVLIVGDYHTTGKTFVDAAWKKIVEAYTEGPPPSSYGSISADSGEAGADTDPWERKVASERPPRSEGPTLLPLCFCDHGHAEKQEFGRQLLKYFGHFDVWAVISCGTASNTRALLEVLEPVDVPILIVVDSTASALAQRQENVLRLTPNNELQAVALMTRARELLAVHFREEPRPFHVFYHHQDNPYVKDLVSTLKRLTEEGSTLLKPSFEADSLRPNRQRSLVISVGYIDTFEVLLKSELTDGSHVILSDGCFTEDVLHLLGRHDRRRKCQYHWTHAAHPYAEYARDGYVAVVRAWQSFMKRSARTPSPGERLRPFLEEIRAYLEDELPTRYRFYGQENQRGGYLVDEVPAHDDAQ